MVSIALGLILITVVEGDANCDEHVDFADINPMITALTEGAVGWAQTTRCPVETFLCVCDLNSDGVVDFLDVDPFIELLFSGGHQPRDCGPVGAMGGDTLHFAAPADAANTGPESGPR